MIQVFKCSSCGALLSYAGESATITCPFCSATVPVPVANRAGRPVSTVQIVAMVFGLALVAAAGISALVVSTRLARTGAVAGPPATHTLSASERDATSGAIARATAIPQSTLDAQSQEATATAQAEADMEATATAETQALATSMAATQTAWLPVFSDAFGNNRNVWPIGVNEDDTMVVATTLSEGKYAWTVAPQHGSSYWNMLPEAGSALTDFYAGVDVTFGRGGEDGMYAYGLVFRHVEDDYGFFGIQSDGTFRVLVVYHTGIYEHYIIGGEAVHTGPGQTNHIVVRSIGPEFIFEINDQVVWHTTEDFPAGRIGLGVDVVSEAGEAQVQFTNFEVRAP